MSPIMGTNGPGKNVTYAQLACGSDEDEEGKELSVSKCPLCQSFLCFLFNSLVQCFSSKCRIIEFYNVICFYHIYISIKNWPLSASKPWCPAHFYLLESVVFKMCALCWFVPRWRYCWSSSPKIHVSTQRTCTTPSRLIYLFTYIYYEPILFKA